MKLRDCISFSFKDALVRFKAESAQQASRYLILHHGDSTKPLWQQHLCTNSHFCRTVVANGYLTQQQMQHAALRYRLGMARDGGVIFWQIDHAGHVYDGKIMYYQDNCHRDHNHTPTWVSAELKHFYLGDDYPYDCLPNFSHCLFGLHLLSNTDHSDLTENKFSNWLSPSGRRAEPSPILDSEKKDSLDSSNSLTKVQSVALQSWSLKPVAVVEAEKTAIICSERYPDFIWLAPGGLEALTPEALFPLRERKVILFPDTDETGETYKKWYAIAQSAQRLLGQPIFVSSFLELHATPEQKSRKIDLVDYIYEVPQKSRKSQKSQK